MTDFVNDWRKEPWAQKRYVSFLVVRGVLECSRSHVYDLLSEGKLVAHNPDGCPGKNGTRIVTASLIHHMETSLIDKHQWKK